MKLRVNLGSRSYDIILENGISKNIHSVLKEYFPQRRFAIVTNNTIADIYKDLLINLQRELNCSMYAIPDGEKYKTIQTWSEILDFLLKEKLERSSIVIAFGGGVVGDVTGFASACFLRGVGYVQIPTTLLSMVDSSVGGKTAVDHPLGKNMIGAFHQPSLVIVDAEFLNTLPEREFLCGYAELFKYSFIGGEEMFSFVKNNHIAMIKKEKAVLLEGIKRSIQIKASVVEKDEFETTGLRSLLNFGHTFGHGIERYFGYEGILHGEAVWLGMHCAIECAKLANIIEKRYLPEYEKMKALMYKPALPQKIDPEKLYSMMFTDKKVAQGKIRLVLPTAPGSSVVRSDIPEEIIKKSISAILT
ncbi:MAG: 3-dehydroquinate synthase [Chitinispirillaceae bacterium]|nr:3-dehydroquinate synthase [Chitinispirillaceae bacterium]